MVLFQDAYQLFLIIQREHFNQGHYTDLQMMTLSTMLFLIVDTGHGKLAET